MKKKDKYSAFLHWLAHFFRSYNSHLQASASKKDAGFWDTYANFLKADQL